MLKRTGKKNIARTIYSKSLIKASILKAKEIPPEVLRQRNTTKNKEIIPFTTIYNPNNPNVFLITKQSFANFHYSKTMYNIFQKKKLWVKHLILEDYSVDQNFNCNTKIIKWKIVEKIASDNLIYVFICKGCKRYISSICMYVYIYIYIYIYIITGFLVKE